MSRKPTLLRHAPVLEEIEPRILYSADYSPLSSTALGDTAELRLLETTPTASPQLITTQASRTQLGGSEIVFVDTQVEDWESLVSDIEQNSGGRSLEVVLIDSQRNGIEQITLTLEQRQDLSAIHVISHGQDGALQLGNTWLEAATLQDNADALQRWGSALSADGDILIYGCDLAESADGQAFVAALSALTGADVAASDDLTGAATLGGDWNLEVSTGVIESAIAITPQAQEAYGHLLDITTGLAGRWAFDTNANDSSGNGRNGTLVGNASINTTATTNIIGGGKLSLDGAGDAVNLDAHTASFRALTQGTIAGWVRATSPDGQIFNMVDATGANSLSFSLSGGYLGVTIAAGSAYVLDVYSNATINDGNWHHVAFTANGSGNQLYIDGVAAARTFYTGSTSTTAFFSALNTAATTTIGAYYIGGYYGVINGMLDDVRVYNRALTSTDVSELAVLGNPSITNLSGDNLSYAEGSGAQVIDQGTAAVVTDNGSANLSGGTLTVSFVAGSDSAEDVLGIRNQGTGAGQIGVSGSNVTYQGVTIGTFTGGSGGANLVITFNASSSAAAATALVKNITFEDTDTTTATMGARTVRLVLTDGDGGTSANVDTTVTVIDALVGHWTFDANANDSSGNDNHGTLVGNASIDTTAATNVVGAGKVSLDGVDDAINLSAHTADYSGLTQGTIAAWVKLTGTGYNTIFDISDGATGANYASFYVSNGKLTFFLRDGGVDVLGMTSTASVNDGNWHHVAVTVDGTGNKLYIDGSAAARTIHVGSDTTTAFFSTLNTKTYTTIGAFYDGTYNGEFGGTLDDVRLYSRALTAADITDLASMGAVNDAPKLTIPIALVNPSFESQSLADEQSTNASITGWTKTGTNTGVWNPSVTWYPGGAADGSNVGYINDGGTISQTTSAIFAAGTDYALTVAVGDSTVAGDSNAWQIRLYAGAQLLGSLSNGDFNPPEGTFADATLSLSAEQLATYSAFYGQNIRVELYDAGTSFDMQFDNVRLTQTATSVVMPGVSFVEDGPAVVLNSSVQVVDVELSALNNFNGATLTLARNGGAAAEDQLAFDGVNVTTSGANVFVGGVQVGTYSFTGGQMVVTFDSNATQARVNMLAQNVVYWNTSEAPPATVTINWTFSDGNSGAQGTGGALQATSSVTVTITGTNDAPTITSNGAGDTAAISMAENTTAVTAVTATDVDLPAQTLTYSIVPVASGGGADAAKFAIDSSSGTLSFLAAPNFEARADADANNVYDVTVQVSDGNGGTDTQAIAVTVTDQTPVGHWTFDANANDTSGNNYNGTLTNGALVDTTAATNNVGAGKVSLDGSNDYVNLSAHVGAFQNLSTGTITAWVYPDTAVEGVIFEASDSGDSNSRIALIREADGSLTFFVREGLTTLLDVDTAANLLPAGTWTHVAVSVDGTGNRLYINGAQVPVGNLTYTAGNSSTSAFFDDVTQLDFMAWGVHRYTPDDSAYSNEFNGFIDDARAYDRPLAADDIAALAVTNVAPTITNLSGDSLAYSEGAGAVVIEQGGNAVVADADSANFDTGTLTVSFTAGGDSAEDVLGIRNQGTGAGQIGVSGSNVTYQGVTIGSFTGGSGGANLVITLNTSATPTAVTALVQNITYENTDTAAPTTGARTVRFVLTDGDGGTSANYDATVTVSAANDAPTFGVGDGQALTSFGSGWAFGRETIVQPDGKILVGGYSDSGGSDDFSLTRYNADGTLDTSFGGGDGFAFAGIAGRAEAMLLQADGKVVLAGYTTTGGYQVCLVRFNANGSLDTSFGGGDGIASSGVTGSAKDVALQADGRFLVAADLSNNNFNLMRFNSDGSLDTNFGGGSGYVSTDIAGGNDRADSLTIQADGKVVLAGFGFNGTSFDFALVRYNTDGSLDTSFNGTGKVLTDFGANSSDLGNEVRIQADGKVVVAGWSDTGGTNDFAITRYNTNGTLDTGFGTSGKVIINLGGSDLAEGLAIQSDGKILVTGTVGINGNDVGLVRLNTDGTLDTTFGGGDGIVTTDYSGASDDRGYCVAVQSDGRIVVSGSTQVGGSGYNVALNRYSSTGLLDTTLDPVNTLDGTPTYTEGGAPVVLDADVQIFDAELSAANNFNGATLTLARNGGANAEDVFSATGTLSPLIDEGPLVLNGIVIGGVLQNFGGTLILVFNGNATGALVNSAMQQIAYSNGSDTPPASAQIDWRFSDGNSGAQGSGVALSAAGSTTVTITATNDAPTGSVTISGTATQGQTLTAANTLADADGLGAIT